MSRHLAPALQSALSDALSLDGAPLSFIPVRGGCIHDSGILTHPDSTEPIAFVKLNQAHQYLLFEAEMDGLSALRHTTTVAAPRPLQTGVTGAQSWLLLEPLTLRSLTASSAELLGRQLVQLHRHTSATTSHGWHRDNYIGSSPQANTWTLEWSRFFCECRLRPQFDRAEKAGFRFKQAAALMEAAHSLLKPHQPTPSFLHGDLWSGNAATLADGAPVVFDPASYYGDRETDIAFTRMFGGFPAGFYRAYSEEWPLPKGAEDRSTLYNLYHLLNHLNLFGEPYGRQANHCIAEILSA